MVDPRQEVKIRVKGGAGALPSSHAVSIGLIVTELIINALKYAFPQQRSSAQIRVTFEMARSDWKLTVSDNGVGRSASGDSPPSTGLGTVLVAALAKQLRAQVVEESSAKGMEIIVTRATFRPSLPRAA
jgi:chemotaxis protein methyltransferase CheR